MSVEAQAIALNHSRAKTPIQKLVLLGIANHDGDGGAYPSVATLARYAVCSPRAVQEAISALVELKEIRRHLQQGGKREVPDYARPNLYEFLLTCPPDCDRSKNHRTPKKRAYQGDLEGLEPPIEPVDKPGAGDAPGAGGAPGPGAPRAPKPVPREPTNSPSLDDPQTARPRVTRSGWDHACTDGSMRHEISRKTGRCAFCGAARTHWEEEL